MFLVGYLADDLFYDGKYRHEHSVWNKYQTENKYYKKIIYEKKKKVQ